MAALPRTTPFAGVPDFAQDSCGTCARTAFEEVGQPYEVDLIRDSKTAGHRRLQPFG
ncbi:thioredoxin domain-containing protein [Muricoccus vinaceus]|uniref:Uncharacterized protein n=1 Tax=Muricoccus vinaceus TaxID=424704 RepID=A0ABV6IR98_9PROT